jgi:hypothetical protein
LSHKTDDVIYTTRNDTAFQMLNDGLEKCQEPRLISNREECVRLIHSLSAIPRKEYSRNSEAIKRYRILEKEKR